MSKKIIGTGSYGTVFQIKGIAVKKLDNQDNGIVLNEPVIMKNSNNKFINKAIDIKVYPNAVYISQDLADSDLHKYLIDKALDQKTMNMWTENIFSGLNYLHRNRIIHGDIKSQNILIFGNQIKICDFSLSHFNSNHDIIHLDFSTGENELVLCTSTHRAPEIWLKKEINYQIDIWSMGCLIFEMINKEYIFPVSIYGSKLNEDNDCIEKMINAFKLFFENRNLYFKTYLVKYKENYLNETIFRCLSLNPMDRSKSLCLERKEIGEEIKNYLEPIMKKYRKKKELCEFISKKLTYEEFDENEEMIRLETRAMKEIGFSGLIEMYD